MRREHHDRVMDAVLLGVLSFAGLHAGCKSEDDSDVKCCEIDPAPSCCMAYGGNERDDGCGTLCDGMPIPSDPAWKIVKDEFGCKKWISEGSKAPCCGSPPEATAPFQCFGP